MIRRRWQTVVALLLILCILLLFNQKSPTSESTLVQTQNSLDTTGNSENYQDSETISYNVTSTFSLVTTETEIENSRRWAGQASELEYRFLQVARARLGLSDDEPGLNTSAKYVRLNEVCDSTLSQDMGGGYSVDIVADDKSIDRPSDITLTIRVKRHSSLLASPFAGGDTFRVIVQDRIDKVYVPRARVDNHDGTYLFHFTIVDASTYDVDIVVQRLEYAGYLGPHPVGDYSPDTGQFLDSVPGPSCPPGLINARLHKLRSFTISKPPKIRGLFSADVDVESLPYCKGGFIPGRWIGNVWRPFTCRYIMTYKMYDIMACTKMHARRTMYIGLVGDSITRGNYL